MGVSSGSLQSAALTNGAGEAVLETDTLSQRQPASQMHRHRHRAGKAVG